MLLQMFCTYFYQSLTDRTFLKAADCLTCDHHKLQTVIKAFKRNRVQLEEEHLTSDEVKEVLDQAQQCFFLEESQGEEEDMCMYVHVYVWRYCVC